MTLRTHQGSCHCRAVTFECELDLAEPTRRCNCSFCRKTRMWKAFALKECFRLLSGEDVLSDYRAADSNWPKGDVHHFFCSRCGVRGFSKGHLDMPPFNGWFHAINIACLDDLEESDFAAIPVEYENGRDNDWENPPPVTAYL